MSTLSPEARALLAAARPAFEPSDEALARALARALQSAPPAPPRNSLEARWRELLLRAGLLCCLLALTSGARSRTEAAPAAFRPPAPVLVLPPRALDPVSLASPLAAPAPPRAELPAARRRSPVRLASRARVATDATRAAQSPRPAEDAPLSDALANALRLYQQERCAEAAPELQRVVEGATGDAGPQVERAQALLARCLYRVGLRYASFAVFREIAEAGRAHSHFLDTLAWLEVLARELPEPAGVLSVVGRYEDRDVLAYELGGEAERSHLLLLLGRARYQDARLEEALALWERIPARSPRFVRARLLASAAHVRLHRASPAVTALRAALASLEAGAPVEGDRAELTDLAWLQLARVYYSTRHYASALAAWDRVRAGGPHWGDALFESAWANFLREEHERALGNIHSLATPYFDRSFYPEAFVLRAVVQFSHCQYEDTEAALAEFHRRFDGLRALLEQQLARSTEAASNVQLVRDLRAGVARFPARLGPVLAPALTDVPVQRHLALLTQLEQERERLARLPASLRESTLGARVLAELAVAQGLATDAASTLVRERFQRAAEELLALENQATAVAIEVLDAQRGELQRPEGENARRAVASRRDVWAVDPLEDGAVWPFNGEVWEDEVGYYRQRVTNRCGR